jgi:hypothetical protein
MINSRKLDVISLEEKNVFEAEFNFGVFVGKHPGTIDVSEVQDVGRCAVSKASFPVRERQKFFGTSI